MKTLKDIKRKVGESNKEAIVVAITEAVVGIGVSAMIGHIKLPSETPRYKKICFAVAKIGVSMAITNAASDAITSEFLKVLEGLNESSAEVTSQEVLF